jgi:hypothetical protein
MVTGEVGTPGTIAHIPVVVGFEAEPVYVMILNQKMGVLHVQVTQKSELITWNAQYENNYPKKNAMKHLVNVGSDEEFIYVWPNALNRKKYNMLCITLYVFLLLSTSIVWYYSLVYR